MPATTDYHRGYNRARPYMPERAIEVTPNDDDDLSFVIEQFRAPSDGNISLFTAKQDPDTDDPVIHPVLEGEVVALRVRRINATGTTVTGTIIGYA